MSILREHRLGHVVTELHPVGREPAALRGARRYPMPELEMSRPTAERDMIHFRTTGTHEDVTMDDPYDLERFVAAQDEHGTYTRAVEELRRGRKETHWMWFVFPQIAGLGESSMSRQFAISSLEEARAYLHHTVLGPRLIECADLVLKTPGGSAAADLRRCRCAEAALVDDLVSPRGPRRTAVPAGAQPVLRRSARLGNPTTASDQFRLARDRASSRAVAGFPSGVNASLSAVSSSISPSFRSRSAASTL